MELVLFTFENGKQGELFVQKATAATIETLAKALTDLNQSAFKAKIIGNRHDEEMHEVLATAEEMAVAIDMGDYFRISPDRRGLNYEAHSYLPQLR